MCGPRNPETLAWEGAHTKTQTWTPTPIRHTHTHTHTHTTHTHTHTHTHHEPGAERIDPARSPREARSKTSSRHRGAPAASCCFVINRSQPLEPLVQLPDEAGLMTRTTLLGPGTSVEPFVRPALRRSSAPRSCSSGAEAAVTIGARRLLCIYVIYIYIYI
jgi:hypothetical protein